MKSYIKSKADAGLGFRTPDHFKGSKFSGKQPNFGAGPAPQVKFNPAQFKTQHKGG